jgi:hypothetical protein
MILPNIFINDSIFTNESCFNGLIFTDISDHLPAFHMRNIFTQIKQNQSINTYQRTVNKTNLTKFLDTGEEISWENIMQCIHSQKHASCSTSADLLQLAIMKPISGCIHIACSGLTISSLLQVVNCRFDASCELQMWCKL